MVTEEVTIRVSFFFAAVAAIPPSSCGPHLRSCAFMDLRRHGSPPDPPSPAPLRRSASSCACAVAEPSCAVAEIRLLLHLRRRGALLCVVVEPVVAVADLICHGPAPVSYSCVVRPCPPSAVGAPPLPRVAAAPSAPARLLSSHPCPSLRCPSVYLRRVQPRPDLLLYCDFAQSRPRLQLAYPMFFRCTR
jgi:hypothetical protein